MNVPGALLETVIVVADKSPGSLQNYGLGRAQPVDVGRGLLGAVPATRWVHGDWEAKDERRRLGRLVVCAWQTVQSPHRVGARMSNRHRHALAAGGLDGADGGVPSMHERARCSNGATQTSRSKARSG